jgi:hypothetical protein
VARLSIPFTGDRTLLKFAPNSHGLNFPVGEVSGNSIQFDVILWGSPEDNQRVKGEIKSNCELIATFANGINKQVKEFNDGLPAQIEAAFAAKLDELSKQHAIFDELGITEEPEPSSAPAAPTLSEPKKKNARGGQIIQIIDKMYVEQLNQINYNVGDVNNAIQSN